jgi:imidazolonepropionase-like amidohydrolase
MVILFTLVEQGKSLGFPPESQAKAEQVMQTGLVGLEAMRRAGVKLCFGSDLLGALHVHQSREFTLRGEVFTPLEILRQATSIGAEMMMLEGKLGCVQPGAFADLLVVDGDPLRDISLLAKGGEKLRAIVRAGEIVKNTLDG